MVQRLKIYFLIVYYLIFFMSQRQVLSSDNLKKGPSIFFKHTSYNFDVAFQGDSVKHSFTFKNIGDETLIIKDVKSSCGCTTAVLSSNEYLPNTGKSIDVTYDTRGKFGHTKKKVTVVSNDPNSPHTLLLQGEVITDMDHPPIPVAKVLFEGSCARCHSDPAKDKYHKELYNKACALCHDFPELDGHWIAPNRYEMSYRSSKHLLNIIKNGIDNSSMPSFLKENGGPLDEKQIESLVEYIKSIKDMSHDY